MLFLRGVVCVSVFGERGVCDVLGGVVWCFFLKCVCVSVSGRVCVLFGGVVCVCVCVFWGVVCVVCVPLAPLSAR